MIVFNNWQISVTGLIARQYDNLSRRIDVEGDLPAGYTWQLLVQCGGNADTILLEPTEKGVGAVLTADNLSKSGEYYIQLRGVLEADGVTKRHTNVVSAYIPESLTGLGTWPKVPTEFAQVENRILELYQHPPVPGSNGYWLVWDTEKGDYVESQLALPDVSVGPPGPAGFSPTVSLTETVNGVRIDVTDQEGTESATVKNGQDGAPGKDGAPGADGAPGKDGSDGQAATLELTGAESLPAGSSPAVVEQAGSTPQARKYLLKLPSGADGKDGQDGQPGQDGAAATVTISRIDLLAYGAAPTVTELEGSTSSARVYALGIPAGKPGDPGTPGADGVSPTVTVARNEANTGAVITATNADGTTTSVEVLDGADGTSYTLPVAGPNQRGGVQPVAKTDDMTQEVGVDETGGLWTAPGGGGGPIWEIVCDIVAEEDVAKMGITESLTLKPLNDYEEFILVLAVAPNSGDYTSGIKYAFSGNNPWGKWPDLSNGLAASMANTAVKFSIAIVRNIGVGIVPIAVWDSYNTSTSSHTLKLSNGTASQLNVSGNLLPSTLDDIFLCPTGVSSIFVGGYQAVLGAGSRLRVYGRRNA